MKCVELHERAWGQETYPKRPALSQILEAEIVVFWKKRYDPNTSRKKAQDELWTITLHTHQTALEEFFMTILFKSTVILPDRVPIRIFRHKKRVLIQAFKFVFKEMEE